MIKDAIRPVRNTVRRMGWDLVRYSPDRELGFRSARFLLTQDVDLLVDVGANTGQYASRMRAHGYRGRMLSIEPLSSAYAELRERVARDCLWDTQQCAVGRSAGKATIHIAGNSVSSSLLEMADAHLDAAPESAYVGSEEVPVRTLDELALDRIRSSSRAFLKIDTQGFEGEILAGGEESLKHLIGVELEMSLVPLYSGQELAPDLYRYLLSRGFELWWVETGFCDPGSGRALQVDAWFFRRGVDASRLT